MKAPYRYDGIEASAYDLIDELSEFDDFDFYRMLIESNPGPVLDLGCGTGRILVPLAEQSIEVVGLDASEDMLAICREKLERANSKARLMAGDMRRFELNESFATIIVPGFSIQLLLAEQELDACLQSCLAHLRPGGQLILPTYMPWEMLESGLDRMPLQKRRESPPDERGQRYVAWQGWEIDKLEQRLTLKNRFQRVDSEDAVIQEQNREMTIRWHLPYEMQSRLSNLGYQEISLYGDFMFEAPQPQSESVIYVAGRTAD